MRNASFHSRFPIIRIVHIVHFIPFIQIVRILQISIPVGGVFRDDRDGQENLPLRRKDAKKEKGLEPLDNTNENQTENFAALRLGGKLLFREAAKKKETKNEPRKKMNQNEQERERKREI